MTIEFKGKILTLVEDADYDGSYTSMGELMDRYFAPAIDERGQKYFVYWEIINNEALEVEDMCDWENPSEIEEFDWE